MPYDHIWSDTFAFSDRPQAQIPMSNMTIAPSSLFSDPVLPSPLGYEAPGPHHLQLCGAVNLPSIKSVFSSRFLPEGLPDVHPTPQTINPTSQTLQRLPPSEYKMPFRAQPHSIYRAVDGPPFSRTEQIRNILDATGNAVAPHIVARITKGFDVRPDEEGRRVWTGYRRNYFAVNVGFTLIPNTQDQFFLQSQIPSDIPEKIIGFAISISGRTQDDEDSRGEIQDLVVHTPKRERLGKPPKQPMVPRNMNRGHANSYTQREDTPTLLSPPYPVAPPTTTHTFERIQFKHATLNNGKRRAQQQFFHVVVELYADFSKSGMDHRYVKIAQCESAPVVVRGRSPGHYRDDYEHGSNPTPPAPPSRRRPRGNPENQRLPAFSSIANAADGSIYHNEGPGDEYRHATFAFESYDSGGSSPIEDHAFTPQSSITMSSSSSDSAAMRGDVLCFSPEFETRHYGNYESRQGPTEHLANKESNIAQGIALPASFSYDNPPAERVGTAPAAGKQGASLDSTLWHHEPYPVVQQYKPRLTRSLSFRSILSEPSSSPTQHVLCS